MPCLQPGRQRAAEPALAPGHVLRGAPGSWGTSPGEPCLGVCFGSWAGGHLRSRNTRAEAEEEEEEADIPGESTFVRKWNGVQGCNTSQMRLGKVL